MKGEWIRWILLDISGLIFSWITVLMKYDFCISYMVYYNNNDNSNNNNSNDNNNSNNNNNYNRINNYDNNNNNDNNE